MVDLSFIQNFYFPQSVLDFLNTSVGNKGIIDYWLIVHFVSVMLLFIAVRWFYSRKTALRFSIAVIFITEIIEIFLFSQGLAIREPLLNTALDIIVGLFGLAIIDNIIK